MGKLKDSAAYKKYIIDINNKNSKYYRKMEEV